MEKSEANAAALLGISSGALLFLISFMLGEGDRGLFLGSVGNGGSRANLAAVGGDRGIGAAAQRFGGGPRDRVGP
ncbi:MAG: hypothetical protein MH825_07705 [Cyanobacteria bacterium]|nr:hypothetical protein [Cyanobacteriota bacterium]